MSTAPLPSRLIGVPDRIPLALSDLAGPAAGVVNLPVRIAWTGLSTYDVGQPKQRLTMYRTLIDCGQRQDFVAYMNAAHLIADWPKIRRLTARGMIALWERRLPELAATH